MESKEHSFEKAYARLEEIVQKLNAGQASLEDSLKLYEEADLLIHSCNKKLLDAEQKVQTLIKNRSGDVALNTEGKPAMQPFTPSEHQYLNQNLPV